MPYKLKESNGKFKVVSPNHPKGFSKKGMTRREAIAQLRAIYASTKGK